MPKTLALISRSNVNEHWYSCNPYSESDIKAIKDPAGLTDRKQITSIPSPFARVDLFKSAFAHLVDSARNDTYQLDGNTIYHKLVSDCSIQELQLAQLVGQRFDEVIVKVELGQGLEAGNSCQTGEFVAAEEQTVSVGETGCKVIDTCKLVIT